MTEEVVNEDEKNLNVEKPSGERDAAENVEKEATKEEDEEKAEDKVKDLINIKHMFEHCKCFRYPKGFIWQLLFWCNIVTCLTSALLKLPFKLPLSNYSFLWQTLRF